MSSSKRMTIPEIAERLEIGTTAVYELLEQGEIPGIRCGRRWIVTRYAYEEWERTCGMKRPPVASSAAMSMLNVAG